MLKRTLITLILVLGAAFLFWSSYSLQNIFYETVGSVQEYAGQNNILLIVLFIVLAALSAMLSPFSSVPLVPIAIIIWGNLLTTTFLFVGWLIGGVLAYGAGYYAGYQFVSQLSSFEKVKYYRERISRKAEFFLIILFRIAMPAEIPGYVLGIARYNFWKYFLATFLAELPFAIVVSYASEALVAKKPAIFVGLAVATFLVISVMFYLFTKKLKTKNE